MKILSNDQLLSVCAQWGSYMNDSDPGTCMYGFSGGDSSFQDKEHALEVLCYVTTVLIDRADNGEDAIELESIAATALDYIVTDRITVLANE